MDVEAGSRSFASCARSRAGGRAPTPSGALPSGWPNGCAISAGRSRSSRPRSTLSTGYVHAAHCLLGIAGSLIAVEVPALGFALVLLAATSLYLDLEYRVYLLRRLFFRRVSQNVVSRPPSGDRARLIICAHLDSARTGAAFSPWIARRAARFRRAPWLGPFRVLFWSLALLLPLLGARMAGRRLDRDLRPRPRPHPGVAGRRLRAGRDRALPDRPRRQRQRIRGRDRALDRRAARGRAAAQPRGLVRLRRCRGADSGGDALVRALASRRARSRADLLPRPRHGRDRRRRASRPPPAGSRPTRPTDGWPSSARRSPTPSAAPNRAPGRCAAASAVTRCRRGSPAFARCC